MTLALLLLGSLVGGQLVVSAQTRQGSAPRQDFPSSGSLSERASFLFPYFVQAGRENGVDPRVLFVVAYLETKFQPCLTSPVGAQGLMQLMPATAARFGVNNPCDFRENLKGGSRYLAFLSRMFKGNLAHILGAYNAGEGAVTAYLYGGSYVGGSGRRYVVTSSTPGFGTGIPQNSETVAYVNNGVQLYQGLLQSRLFDAYSPPPAGAVALTAKASAPPSFVRRTAADNARAEVGDDADGFSPTNSFYFGLEEREASGPAPAPASKQEPPAREAVTRSYVYP